MAYIHLIAFNQGMEKKVIATFSANKTFGSGALGDGYQGSAASNPTELAVFNVFAVADSSTDAAAIRVQVQIDYSVVFEEFIATGLTD